MNWEEIIEYIVNSNNIKILFMSKKSNKAGFNFFEPGIDGNLEDSIFREIKSSAEELRNMNLENYNPTMKVSEAITVKNKYDTLLIDEFESGLQPDNFEDIEFLAISKIDYFVYKIFHGNHYISIVSKHRKVNLKGREKLFTLSGKRFKSFDEDRILRFSTNIDVVIGDNYIYSTNSDTITSLFDLREEIQHYAKLILENDTIDTSKIANFSSMKEKLLNDGRLTKRLAKIYEDQDRVGLFSQNIEDTIEVIKSQSLDINYDETAGQLIYDEETNLNEMVGILQDSYYKTLIGKRYGEDKYN